jgi:hypothetical protein
MKKVQPVAAAADEIVPCPTCRVPCVWGSAEIGMPVRRDPPQSVVVTVRVRACEYHPAMVATEEVREQIRALAATAQTLRMMWGFVEREDDGPMVSFVAEAP